jgi:cytoskeleton protein RodZ
MGELGTRLIRVREARGLTLEDAERDTRISRRYLEALEAEQFEIIPAPVYARGFLRSYSQYLGLDPQEMLALFPRPEDPMAQANGRATREAPVAAQSASRPNWRQPESTAVLAERPGREARAPARPAGVEAEPEEYIIGGPAPAPRRPGPPPGREPTIGVDIAGPAPTRRINTNPAAQARGLTVLAVAAAAILAVVLLAFIISRLGGGSDSSGDASSSTGLTPASETSESTSAAGTSSEPGVVPDVTTLQAAAAKKALEDAGFVVQERREKNNAPKGTVIQQAPVAGVRQAEGLIVFIVVSDGP